MKAVFRDTESWTDACYNPNTIKSYKILQKLSPKHAAHGVAQSPYPIYRHGKACLSRQPPWRAAPDPRLARSRSRVGAPGPAGALRALFFLHPPFLPPSGDSHLPHQTHESVRVMFVGIGNARVPKKTHNCTKNGTEKKFASQWLSICPNSMISSKFYVETPCFSTFITLRLGKGHIQTVNRHSGPGGVCYDQYILWCGLFWDILSNNDRRTWA